MTSKQIIENLLRGADIKINGERPTDIRIHNEELFDRILRDGSLGFGESYMDGWWDTDDFFGLMSKIFHAELEKKIRPSITILKAAIKARLMNLQSKNRAFEIGKRHYDIGNDLYEKMLGPSMTYTCGYWKNANTLEEAQEAKLDLVCKKIGLKKGDRVLDIGGGWGSFARHAAKEYGAEVVAITVSKEQVELGRELTKGLPVEIRLQDYRQVQETFDHVVSLGMFEHVGVKNYRTYMETIQRCLKDDGFFLLHSIGSNASRIKNDPWIEKYIFPNSMLPSIAQIGKSIEKLFVMEDWHNFSAYYEPTLHAWWKNFDTSWPLLKEKYGERFYKMWKFYILSAAANFHERKIQLWQIVLHKHGVPGGYERVS